MGELKKVFRPELLNRIDEVIVFHKLAKDEIKPIVDLLLKRLREQMAVHEVAIELTDERQGAARREGLRPGDGRPAAAPRDPAPHRGPARRLRARPSSSPARRSSSTARRARRRSTSRSSPGPEAREGGRPGRRRLRAGRDRQRRRLRRRGRGLGSSLLPWRRRLCSQPGAAAAGTITLGRGLEPWKLGQHYVQRAGLVRFERYPGNAGPGCVAGVGSATRIDYYRGLRVAWRSGVGGRLYLIDVATTRAGDRSADGFVVGSSPIRQVRHRHAGARFAYGKARSRSARRRSPCSAGRPRRRLPRSSTGSTPAVC